MEYCAGERKNGGKGVRIFVDQNKLNPETMPEMCLFFKRQRSDAVKAGGPARKASAEIIVKEFLACGRDIFTVEDVIVTDTDKPPVKNCSICEKCGESFTVRTPDEKICQYCSGELGYYQK